MALSWIIVKVALTAGVLILIGGGSYAITSHKTLSLGAQTFSEKPVQAELFCNRSDCSGHGDGELEGNSSFTCACDELYYGPTCGWSCPLFCSGLGSCKGTTNETTNATALFLDSEGNVTCECPRTRGGSGCEVTCPQNCSLHGQCGDDGMCQCDSGFGGPGCEVQCDGCKFGVCVSSDSNCSDSNCSFGVPPGICQCLPGYYGENCDTRTHPCFINVTLHVNSTATEQSFTFPEGCDLNQSMYIIDVNFESTTNCTPTVNVTEARFTKLFQYGRDGSVLKAAGGTLGILQFQTSNISGAGGATQIDAGTAGDNATAPENAAASAGQTSSATAGETSSASGGNLNVGGGSTQEWIVLATNLHLEFLPLYSAGANQSFAFNTSCIDTRITSETGCPLHTHGCEYQTVDGTRNNDGSQTTGPQSPGGSGTTTTIVGSLWNDPNAPYAKEPMQPSSLFSGSWVPAAPQLNVLTSSAYYRPDALTAHASNQFAVGLGWFTIVVAVLCCVTFIVMCVRSPHLKETALTPVDYQGSFVRVLLREMKQRHAIVSLCVDSPFWTLHAKFMLLFLNTFVNLALSALWFGQRSAGEMISSTFITAISVFVLMQLMRVCLRGSHLSNKWYIPVVSYTAPLALAVWAAYTTGLYILLMGEEEARYFLIRAVCSFALQHTLFFTVTTTFVVMVQRCKENHNNKAITPLPL